MNKTVYLRDDEGPIWERARELAGDKLSPIIVAALKGFIAEKEAEAKGFERIELFFDDADDHNFPKRKAFYGKWVLSRAAPYQHEPEFDFEGDETTVHCAVAVTAKGSAVFFSWTESPGRDPYCFRLAIFPSLESAAEHRIYNGPARQARETIGVPVEELDI